MECIGARLYKKIENAGFKSLGWSQYYQLDIAAHEPIWVILVDFLPGMLLRGGC